MSKIIDHALYLAKYDDDVVTKPSAQIHCIFLFTGTNEVLL